MPEAFTAALYLLQGVGVIGGLGTTAVTVIGYTAFFATVYQIGAHQRRKAARRARDAYNAGLEDRTVMTATTDAARSRVYGRVRNVDGVLFKATRGANKEFYTLVIAVAGHEVDAIEDVYFSDLKVALDADGYVQTPPYFVVQRTSGAMFMTLNGGAGSVTLPHTPVAGTVAAFLLHGGDGGTDQVAPSVTGNVVSVVSGTAAAQAQVTYQYDTGKSHARVRKYLGAATQDLSAELMIDFPALVTANDRFAGIALLRVDLEYSQDAFPSGVPSFSAVLRGAKVFDPRTATTAWSQNPAPIARDWSLYPWGGGMAAVNIDDASTVTAANACDVDASFARPSGTVVMDTYQAGIVCRLDADPIEALGEIVEAMGGRWGWAGGALRIVAGAYRAPVATITEDWISDAGEIQIQPAPQRSELVNVITPTIADREHDYIAAPMPRIAPASYITADGGEYPRELQMSAVTHPLHAQHVAGVLLRDARESLSVTLPCNMRAWPLELFDCVNVTLPRFGWSDKLFEVLGWRFAPGGGVALTLKETEAAIWQPDAGFSDLGYNDNTALPKPWQVSPVSGLAASSSAVDQADGQIVTKTVFSWLVHPDAAIRDAGAIELQIFKLGFATSGIEWINDAGQPLVWLNNQQAELLWQQILLADPAGLGWQSVRERGDQTATVVVGLISNAIYLARARAVNTLGVKSVWSASITHRIARPPRSSIEPLLGDGENIVRNGDGVNGLDGWSGMSSYGAQNWFGTGVNDPFLYTAVRNNLYGPPFPVKPGDQFFVTMRSVPQGGLAGDMDVSIGLVLRETPGGPGIAFPRITRAAALTGPLVTSGVITVNTALYWAQPIIVLEGSPPDSAGWYFNNIQVRRRYPPGLLDARGLTLQDDLGTDVVKSSSPFPVDAAVALGFNPQFSNWPSLFPAGWNNWSNGTFLERETVAVRTGPYAVRFATQGQSNVGIFRQMLWSTTPLPYGSYLDGSIDLQIAADSGGGLPGLLVKLFTDSALSSYAETVIAPPSRAIGIYQRVPFTARVDAGARIYGIELYLLAAWTGMPGGSFNGTVLFDNLTFDFYDATTDSRSAVSLKLIARGTCVLQGVTAWKSGNDGWDSDVYTIDSFVGCFASAVPAQNNKALMFGLNSDPLTDQNYTSLDYAWYCRADGVLDIYESGSQVVSGAAAYSAGDVLALVYDGVRVYYLHNGTVRRTVSAPANVMMFFDSSFYSQLARLVNINFGAVSSVTDIGTNQIQINAATAVYFAQQLGTLTPPSPWAHIQNVSVQGQHTTVATIELTIECTNTTGSQKVVDVEMQVWDTFGGTGITRRFTRPIGNGESINQLMTMSYEFSNSGYSGRSFGATAIDKTFTSGGQSTIATVKSDAKTRVELIKR